jgi:2-oxoglutarate ferredoxin oxidoreductase subunit beta
MPKQNKFDNDIDSQWCPGCPNFKILQAFKSALLELKKSPHQICLVSGIGQAAKLPHYLHCNFFNGLHGRAVPAAIGIQAANPELTTMVVTGDGDCYGEGGNHFLHALRRNPDITVVAHNNEIYALTKGQASPTTPEGEKRSIQSKGVHIMPLNMPAVAIIHGCGFVARGFAGDPDHLKDLLVAAVQHRGLSYIDVIQPCIGRFHGTKTVSNGSMKPMTLLIKPRPWKKQQNAMITYRSGCCIALLNARYLVIDSERRLPSDRCPNWIRLMLRK